MELMAVLLIGDKWQRGLSPAVVHRGRARCARDAHACVAIRRHRQLLKAGALRSRQVWEGMWRGCIWNADIPEANEMCATTTKFFKVHLG